MTTKYIIASSGSEFYHHGILGMHWGIRRFQKKDGSLTPAGRKRQNKLRDTGTKKKTTEKKPISEMTKKQIERETERLKALQQYNELQRSEQLSRAQLEKNFNDLVRAGQEADINYKIKLMELSQKEYSNKNYEKDTDLEYRRKLAEVKGKEIQNKLAGESWLKKNMKVAGSIAVKNITEAVTKKAGEKLAEKIFGDKDAFKGNEKEVKEAAKEITKATKEVAGSAKKVVKEAKEQVSKETKKTSKAKNEEPEVWSGTVEGIGESSRESSYRETYKPKSKGVVDMEYPTDSKKSSPASGNKNSISGQEYLRLTEKSSYEPDTVYPKNKPLPYEVSDFKFPGYSETANTNINNVSSSATTKSGSKFVNNLLKKKGNTNIDDVYKDIDDLNEKFLKK